MPGLGSFENGSKGGWTWSGPCGLSVRPHWIRLVQVYGWTKRLRSCRREKSDAYIGATNWDLATVAGANRSHSSRPPRRRTCRGESGCCLLESAGVHVFGKESSGMEHDEDRPILQRSTRHHRSSRG